MLCYYFNSLTINKIHDGLSAPRDTTGWQSSLFAMDSEVETYAALAKCCFGVKPSNAMCGR